MENSNQTPEDARHRVMDARIGCLANATDEYLSALRHEIVAWLQSMDDEIARREQTAADIRRLQGEPTRPRRGVDCNCGAQDGPEHRPHNAGCAVLR